MAFTYKAVASVWVVVFGLVALSASGTITGAGLVLLVLGGLIGPAIILTTVGTLRNVSVAPATGNARVFTAADAQDLVRMDSDHRFRSRCQRSTKEKSS